MAKVFKLLIFDLDGTILYTLDDLTDAVNHGLEENGYPKRNLDEVRSFVGNGIKKLISRAVPTGTKADAEQKVYESFTEYYKIHCKDKTKPYDGILDVVRMLKQQGYLLAVVSNKADYGVQELCAEFFEGIFDAAVGERDGIRRKPAPDSVLEVLSKLNVDKDEAIYIGDSEVDIETAHNAGLKCISVTWGFRDEELLVKSGADIIVNNMRELTEYIDLKA